MFGKLTYAPHRLYVKETVKTFDEHGNFEGESESYRFVCNCRCDDAGTKDAISVNGEKFFPSYHIVAEKGVNYGDYVRVENECGCVRAEGKVVRTAYANYFDLHQAWI